MGHAGTVASILAHYGGVDEIGVFVVPAVAVILLMRWAERRAKQRRQDGSTAEESSADAAPSDRA